MGTAVDDNSKIFDRAAQVLVDVMNSEHCLGIHLIVDAQRKLVLAHRLDVRIQLVLAEDRADVANGIRDGVPKVTPGRLSRFNEKTSSVSSDR